MPFQKLRNRPDIWHAATHRSSQTVGAEHDTDSRGLYEEPAWRSPSSVEGDILISRWVDGRSFHRYEKSGVAVRSARYWCCAEDNAAQAYEGSTNYI
jgi:hypothetical protein